MRKIVLVFGLISGAIMAAMLVVQFQLHGMYGAKMFEYGELVGYSTMVVAFLLVFFGIRSYREQNGGAVSFGKAFTVGILITLVASAVYVGAWEIYYYSGEGGRQHIKQYMERSLQKMRERGAPPAQLAEERRKMEQFARAYENPLVNIGMTFMEPLPVGLILTLVSAAILRKSPSPLAPRR